MTGQTQEDDIVRILPVAGGGLVVEHVKLLDTLRLGPETVKSISDYWISSQVADASSPGTAQPETKLVNPVPKPKRKPRAKK